MGLCGSEKPWGQTTLTCFMMSGFPLYGLETSPKRMEYASGNGITVIQDEPSPGVTFDFINSEQVFEHLPNPLGHLRRLVRWLNPQGFLRIAVPNADLHRDCLGRPDWRAGHDAFHPLEHINGFSPRSLRRLVQEAGLEVVVPLPMPSFQPSLKQLIRARLWPKKSLRAYENSTRLYLRIASGSVWR